MILILALIVATYFVLYFLACVCLCELCVPLLACAVLLLQKAALWPCGLTFSLLLPMIRRHCNNPGSTGPCKLLSQARLLSIAYWLVTYERLLRDMLLRSDKKLLPMPCIGFG